MNNFLKSEDLYIFPCARRLQYDVGAKLSTEENLTNIPSLAGRKNYIVGTVNTIVESVEVTWIHFVIGRYFVRAKKQNIIDCLTADELETATEIYASIRFSTTPLANIDDSIQYTTVLANQNSTSADYLDEVPSGEADSYFFGVKFTPVKQSSETEAIINLKLFVKNGDLWDICSENLGSIDTDQLADQAVTTEKIADQAVTTEKIKDGAVTPDKFSFSTNFRNIVNADLPSLGNITNVGTLTSEATAEAIIVDTDGKITSMDLKTNDPTLQDEADNAITNISQDSYGKITALKSSIPNGKLNVLGTATGEVLHEIFSANRKTDNTINVSATVGDQLTKNQSPIVKVTTAVEDNNNLKLNFAFDGIIGNGFTYKVEKNECTIAGDYYIADGQNTTKPGEKDHVYIYTPDSTSGSITNFSDAGNMKGNGIANIECTSTNKNIDNYTITYDNAATDTFTVTNAVDAFGYCTWSGQIATADYPSFKWSWGGDYTDNGRSISLYFATSCTESSPKLELADKQVTITNGPVYAGWYRGVLNTNKNSITLTPIVISGDVIKFNSGILDGNEATQSSKGLLSASDKTKLDGIATGAQVNVKPDWNAASTAAAGILNKPTIPTVSFTGQDANTIPYFKNNVATRGLKIWVQADGTTDPTSGMQKGDILIKY